MHYLTACFCRLFYLLCIQVGNDGPACSIGDVQSLLLAVMCNIVSMLSSRKPTESEPVDTSEKKQKSCFVNSAIAFCKFQHLDPVVPIKAQVSELQLSFASEFLSEKLAKKKVLI